ncbi:hypothetical protein SCORR_v1c08370 [Spiroplasma corruscae]|uniref:Uncharacterized protein n=1 Tax=Spiroplasma corruscae TaxID=216934 RepID=A0A222EPZ5_9MOLU|nr:hypothetical protein [Spiroplasma corruscae]ASP28609.1 hypothetical protein SCORR_v1c08370 [Spiroplasma corruscae]
MLVILLTLFSIIFLIFLIILIIYLNLRKYNVLKYEKYKLENNENAFTYKNILKCLGGIQNIKKVDENKIYLLSTSLVNKNKLKYFKFKYTLSDEFIILEIKGFNIKLFYKKLNNQLSDEII